MKELLKDYTTNTNIIYATDMYEGNLPTDSIEDYTIFKPRYQKTKEEQEKRTSDKAEVFTPSWVCNKQNNLVDNEWFGIENVFNVETEKGWEPTGKSCIDFNGKDPFDYIKSIRLEITCGEAPYITSVHDTVTGEYIEVSNRIGLLDRKLRVAKQISTSDDEWQSLMIEALKSVYGYEYQGDNLYLARCNVYQTLVDFNEGPLSNHNEIVDIICKNFLQMDGLTYTIPMSCHKEKVLGSDMECEGCLKDEATLHNGIYAEITDWEKNERIKFLDLAYPKQKKLAFGGVKL